MLWDRKVDGGFPEVKELKRRVRDVIQPGRDLGHVDRDYHGRGKTETGGGEQGQGGGGEVKKEGGGEVVVVGGKKEEGTAGSADEKTGRGGGVERGAECEDCQ